MPVSAGFLTIFENEGEADADGMLIHEGKEAYEASRRTGQRKCEPGTYCVGGEAKLCPEGFFGQDYGLATPECTARCFPSR